MSDTILIVDDHPVVLEGLALILGEVMQPASLLTAADGAGARDRSRRHRDIRWIFLDVNLPDVDGIELIASLEGDGVTAFTVVLSSDADPALIDRAQRGKADGFLSKSFDRVELARCIEAIEQGEFFIVPEQRRQLKHFRESVLVERQSIQASLSERQRQTLLLLSKGYSNLEIARSLGIVESTVKSHVYALMTLFEADNRTHCVAEARRIGLIT